MVNIRSGLANVVTRMLLLPLNMIPGIVVARYLGPEGKGELSVFLLCVNMVALGFSLGLGNAAVYHIRRGVLRRDQATGMLTWLWAVLAVAGGLTGLQANRMYPGLSTGLSPELVLHGLLVFPLALLKLFVIALLLGFNRILDYNLFQITDAVVLGVATYVSISQGAGVEGFANLYFSLMVGLMGLQLVRLCRLTGCSVRVPGRVLLSVVKYGLKNQPSNLFLVMFYQFDQLLVAKLSGVQTVGIYSVAVTLASLLLVVPNAVGPLLFASWSEGQGNRRELVPAVGRLLLGMSAVAGVGLVVMSPLLTRLFGVRFLAAQKPLWVLIPGVVLMSLAYVYMNYLASVGKPELGSLVLGVALVLQVGIDLVTIPWWGEVGAALSSSISYAVAALLSVGIFMRLEQVSPNHVFRWNDLDRSLLRVPVARICRIFTKVLG